MKILCNASKNKYQFYNLFLCLNAFVLVPRESFFLTLLILSVTPSQQSKDCLRLDETMLVKQLLPEICHFIHTYREGHQHAAELRASASAVLFSLSCNNFNAVFSRISTRYVFSPQKGSNR